MLCKSVLISAVCVLFTITVQRAYAQEDVFLRLDSSSLDFCNVDNPNSKICSARGAYYQRRVWNHWTGYMCYYYTNDYRFKYKYEGLTAGFRCSPDDTVVIPVTLVDDTFFWYDYTNVTSQEYIRDSFKSEDFFQIWMSCCKAAVSCCEDHMNATNILPNDKYACPAVWDAWSCFPPSKADSIRRIPCSDQAYSTTDDICVMESEKECFSNGTWNQDTNYESCAIAPVLRRRHEYHVIALSVSIAVALPAAIIFLCFRKFRTTTRIILHRNLICILIVRDVFTIMTKEIVILDALKSSGSNMIMEENGVACRVLAFFESVAKNGIYACMLVDGFYLHKTIVRVFADEPQLRILYFVVLGLSFTPALLWAILRGSKEAEDCWVVDDGGGDQWALDGIRIAILVVNTFLLLDIIRVLLLKLRNNSTSHQNKAAFRATLFLIPLFGVHIIVTADRGMVGMYPTCAKEDIYYYASYTLEGLQAIAVSVLFCYLNSEVHTELENAYRKFAIYVEQKFGWNIRRKTILKRKATAATYVDRDRTLSVVKGNALSRVQDGNESCDSNGPYGESHT